MTQKIYWDLGKKSPEEMERLLDKRQYRKKKSLFIDRIMLVILLIVAFALGMAIVFLFVPWISYTFR